MHVIRTYKHAAAPRDQPFVLLLLCSASTSSHSDLIVCLTKGLGNSEIYLLVLDSLPTDWIRTLIAGSVRYIRNGSLLNI